MRTTRPGRRTLRVDTAQSLPVTNAFEYNLQSEVTDATMGTNEYAYVYDPIGDQKSAKPKAQPPGDRDFKAVRTRGARSGIPRRSGNCNMLTNGVWVYTWDAEIKRAPSPRRCRRATAILRPGHRAGARSGIPRRSGNRYRLVSACSNNVLLVTNAYDHLSRRIRKEVYVADSGSWILASDSSFLYDGWNVVREVRGQGSEVSTNYYTWGLDLSGTMQGAGGVGGLLAVTTVNCEPEASPTLSSYFPAYDANGNIVQYFDATGGVAVACTYDAFGNTISETVNAGPGSVHLPHRFSTKYFDPETGMYYYDYRFYHPELGRWVNRDPIGEDGGNRDGTVSLMNLFLFVNNSGISRHDFLGLMSDEDACAQELRKESAATKGLLICNDGKYVTCARREMPRDKLYPGIRACTLQHEKLHMDRRLEKGLTCNRCGVYAPVYYPLKQSEEECWAYLDSVDCLKKAMYQECGERFLPGVHETDRGLSACARAYVLSINDKIARMREHCGAYLGWSFHK